MRGTSTTRLTCHRCHAPLTDSAHTLRIDADPPLSAPLALPVCSTCLHSLQRWMLRRRSLGHDDLTGESYDELDRERDRGERDSVEHARRRRRRGSSRRGSSRGGWTAAFFILLAILLAAAGAFAVVQGYRPDDLLRRLRVPMARPEPPANRSDPEPPTRLPPALTIEGTRH